MYEHTENKNYKSIQAGNTLNMLTVILDLNKYHKIYFTHITLHEIQSGLNATYLTEILLLNPKLTKLCITDVEFNEIITYETLLPLFKESNTNLTSLELTSCRLLQLTEIKALFTNPNKFVEVRSASVLSVARHMPVCIVAFKC